ncbi:MAG: hypothetical protein HYT70_02515 [Candidatus Aenigmarchaeota archaeon]|nr:hypothetical protein [Candidatus Aenigmarchaeota archaeon]
MEQKTWMAFAALLFLFISPVLADENGKIYQLSYSPGEPVVLEDIKISVSVENPSNEARNYLLEQLIVKDGRVADSAEFAFSLESGKGISFNPTYAPQDIGKHEIIFRLYDRLKTNLYDTKILELSSVSNIGPFDIIVDPLATRIRPGTFLPTKLILENMGVKGTDIEVRISVNCPNKTLTQSSTIFMPAKGHSERLVSVETCQEEGLYDVTASIIIFNKEWVSSSSHFFVNASYIQLSFEFPENITLKPGQSVYFPVEVTNNGTQEVSDLKFVIQRIPLAWQHVSPSSVVKVKPNEIAVFIVNITVPLDADPTTYNLRATAVAEETLERQITHLEILPLGAVAAPIPIAGSASIINYVWWLLGIAGIGSTGFIIRKKLKERQDRVPYTHSDRSDILKRIKDKIKK